MRAGRPRRKEETLVSLRVPWWIDGRKRARESDSRAYDGAVTWKRDLEVRTLVTATDGLKRGSNLDGGWDEAPKKGCPLSCHNDNSCYLDIMTVINHMRSSFLYKNNISIIIL